MIDTPAKPNLVREAILRLVALAPEGRSIDPSEAAKEVSPEHYQKLIKDVRAEAVRLAKAGEVSIYRKGKPVDPDNFKGVWRIGRVSLEK